MRTSLTFYAVRNDERVPTEVAAVEDVVAGLVEQIRWCLQSAQYSVGAPASNDAEPAEALQVLDATAVLELSPDGHYWARYDQNTTEGWTDEGRSALDIWSAAMGESASHEFMLESGDFLIFDNYRVLHRRRAFTPGPIPGRRGTAGSANGNTVSISPR
ncbi:MAG: TauD/TfdA family dioxygenase, partial [Pseudonocardiaceae bacterium]